MIEHEPSDNHRYAIGPMVVLAGSIQAMSAHKHILTVRLSTAQYRTLERLERKLNIDKSNVIRLALTRIAEAENVLPPSVEQIKEKDTNLRRFQS